MTRFLLALIFGLATALAAQAQVQLGDYARFQTRYGALQVTGERGQGNQGLAFEGTALPVEDNYSYTILGAWALEGSDHDWVLAQSHHGGNMCGPGITVIHVSEGRVQVVGVTEGCEGQVSDLRVTQDALELDIFEDGLQQRFNTYRFTTEGMTVTPAAAPFSADDPAGSGADATRWIGQHPYRIFEDPTERARFLTIMTEEQIRDLASRIGPANNVVQRGDWVLGAGCQAHACNAAAGAWGIRISDGAVAAAIFDSGAAPVTYGAAASEPVFAGWIAENSL
ncbi:hypothetical protein [Nioella nitratireducens]|uniref:hypothetical protein n=1 Tax=Nioella nitratireducens TaxID=1287720 RepID=UPI0008FD8BAC|nr:hypothetical protein [Nioella nitratireducens]